MLLRKRAISILRPNVVSCQNAMAMHHWCSHVNVCCQGVCFWRYYEVTRHWYKKWNILCYNFSYSVPIKDIIYCKYIFWVRVLVSWYRCTVYINYVFYLIFTSTLLISSNSTDLSPLHLLRNLRWDEIYNFQMDSVYPRYNFLLHKGISRSRSIVEIAVSQFAK